MAQNTITLQEAQAWAQNWNDKKLDFFSRDDLKAFSIDQQIIMDALAPVGVVGIRTYLGLDDNLTPHLMIVGIDVNGNDVINEQSGYHIYNYSAPCPQQSCSSSSPTING